MKLKIEIELDGPITLTESLAYDFKEFISNNLEELYPEFTFKNTKFTTITNDDVEFIELVDNLYKIKQN